jgi:hypothetical protein
MIVFFPIDEDSFRPGVERVEPSFDIGRINNLFFSGISFFSPVIYFCDKSIDLIGVLL